jgi:hypothetical protein
MAKQDGLDELRQRQRDIRQRQRYCEACFGREQTKDAQIRAQESHRQPAIRSPKFRSRGNGCPRTPFMSRRRSEGGKVKYAHGQDLFAPHTGMMADKFGVGWIIDVPDLSRVDRGGGQ